MSQKIQSVNQIVESKAAILDQVNHILSGIVTDGEKLKDFMVGEIPHVVKEFLTWGLINSVYDIMLAVLLMMIIYFSYKVSMNNAIKYNNMTEDDKKNMPFNSYYEMKAWIFGVCSLICGLVMVMGPIWNAIFAMRTILMILFAPRIYIIQYAVHNLK